MQIFSLSTLLKLNFFFQQQLPEMHDSSLTTTYPLATLAIFFMKLLPSQTKSLHFLNPATITFVNFTVSTSRQPAPLPPPLSSPNSTTVTLSVSNLPNCQLNRLQQIQNSLARAVVKAPESSHITPILKSLHWFKVNERIEYKLLSLTYKVLTPVNLDILTI